MNSLGTIMFYPASEINSAISLTEVDNLEKRYASKYETNDFSLFLMTWTLPHLIPRIAEEEEEMYTIRLRLVSKPVGSDPIDYYSATYDDMADTRDVMRLLTHGVLRPDFSDA